MSLWPNIPLVDFSLATDALKIKESFDKIVSTGKTPLFNGMISGPPTLQPNQALKQILGVQNVEFVNNMFRLGPGFQISGNQSSSIPIDNEGLTRSIRVKLVPVNSQGSDADGVTFFASPTIGESRQASWDSVPVTHHPGEILAYKTTSSRSWEISSAKLISRTPKEATSNLVILNKIRSWVMPYYGYGTEKSQKNKLGAPPPILIFSGYGDANIGPVPVVLLSYNFNYSSDMEMIQCEQLLNDNGEILIKAGTPFPIISEISLTLKESYSPREFSSFDIVAYKMGDMKNAYNVSTNGPNISTPKTTSIGTNVSRSESRNDNQATSPYYNPLPGEIQANILDLNTYSNATAYMGFGGQDNPDPTKNMGFGGQY
jgi:hypothetical protein